MRFLGGLLCCLVVLLVLAKPGTKIHIGHRQHVVEKWTPVKPAIAKGMPQKFVFVPKDMPFDGILGSRKYKDTLIHGMCLRISWDTLAVGPQEVVWYMPGAGQLGNGNLGDTTFVVQYGPEFWLRNGWDGTVVLGNGTHRPVFCTLIQSRVINSSAFTRPSDIKQVLDGFIASRFRTLGKDSAWSCMGFSAGAWVWSIFNSYLPATGNYTYYNYFKTEVDIEGVVPSDQYDASLAYPQKFGNRVNLRKFALLGFDQTGSGAIGTSWQIQQNMVDSNASASAFNIFSFFGSGGHSNFNDFLNPATTNWTSTNTNLRTTNGGEPSVFIGPGQNVWQWDLRQSDTTLISNNQPPSCFAGNPQTITQAQSTTTLTGRAFGTNGATLTTTHWTVVVDPANGTVVQSPNTLTTGITGMNIWGNYVFKLVVTDNHGLQDSSYIRITMLPSVNAGPFHRFNLPSSGGGLFYPNATTEIGCKGGDTLVLPNGYQPAGDIFGNLSGDAGHPVYIMGPDAGVDTSAILRFDDHCQYVSIIQNPKNPNPFSLYSYDVGGGLANNFDFEHVHVNGWPLHGQGNTGIIWKRHIDTTSLGQVLPETIAGNYLMENITFANLIVDSTDGEALYIGPSAPNGGDEQGPVGFYPVRMRHVVIHDVKIHHSGWDGIQLSGALDSCFIYNDSVYDYGWQNIDGQNAGIIGGSTEKTDIFNNWVVNGTGNGIQEFGFGSQQCYNNFLDSTGRGNNDQSIFQNDRPPVADTLHKLDSIYDKCIYVLTNAPQKVYYYNNTIQHPQTAGAIVSNNDNGTALADSIYRNIFCIPGANPSTYAGLYIKTLPTAVFASSNTLVTTCGAPFPTVNPGPNQTVIYPAFTFTTLSGTATGNGGATITSTLWTQISGPNTAAITTASSLTTTVTGLKPGTYVFQLQATDSNSNTSFAQMQVTVVQSIYILHKRGHKRHWE